MASELAAALAKVQAELRPIERKAEGQAGTRKYKYADLAAISAEVLPLLGRHGLAFTARPTLSDDGKLVLAYSLLHEGGEREDGAYPLPTGAPQQLGSAITYARRYTLCAITGAAPEGEDDDGAAAAEARAPARPRQQRERPPVRPVSELPRNQDGQISRSQTTDEEKAAAGVMTDAQQKEHTALRNGATTGKAPGVQRGPVNDDPWASALPPEEQPGSVDEGQMRKLQAILSKLFTKDERDQRLAAAEQIIGRQLTGPRDGRTSSNLAYTEASKLIDTLGGVSREDLIERLALATGSTS